MCDFSSKWGYLVKSCFFSGPVLSHTVLKRLRVCHVWMVSLYGRETQGRPILTRSPPPPLHPLKRYGIIVFIAGSGGYFWAEMTERSLRLPQYTAGNGSVAATVPRSGELENIWSLFWFASPVLISNVCWACSWRIAKDRNGFISQSSLP